MTELGWFRTRNDAELARLLLAEAGIPAVLAPDQTGDHPADLSGGGHLLVADADAEYAATILSSVTPQRGRSNGDRSARQGL